ncbi:MAG: hypothetical protein IH820_18375, partial [Bacteroidetes bacterium]|nr:hypothetical protein [Bacteroidota bacterium]
MIRRLLLLTLLLTPCLPTPAQQPTLREADRIRIAEAFRLAEAIQEDVFTECKDEILDLLWDWAKRDIGRSLAKGFPEYYKERLTDLAFINEGMVDFETARIEAIREAV